MPNPNPQQPTEVRYNPSIKVYYGGISEETRLVPAPNISINHELIYANDVVIGYTPVLTLNGYATSIDLRYPVDNKVYGFTDTLENIEKIRNIINGNGRTLTVIDTNDSSNFVLRAIGGTIRSFSINETENNWNNYATYTAEIEFNEMWFGNCAGGAVSKPCGDLYDGLVDTPELVDIKKYRIKSFNDSFSIDLQPDEANENQNQLPCGLDDTSNTNNPNFGISYKINAIGKHYFNENGRLMPAWEQAKRFVQYKINTQMGRLRSGSFMDRMADGLPGSLSQLYSPAPSGNGLLSDIDFTTEFKIYNETIQCEASEAEGSFAATYSAQVKKTDPDQNNDIRHSFSKSISVADDGAKKNVTITLDGSIQGLIETGLTGGSGNVIELLDSGSMFLFNGSGEESAYEKALNAFNEIGGENGLSCDFIQCLGIGSESLGLDPDQFGDCAEIDCASPQSFSVTHNYTEGSINYSATFTTESVCNNLSSDYTNVTIGIEDSVDIIAEFIIPGRADGPIIQKIGAKTPKKTTVNIEGAARSLSVCCPSGNNNGESSSYGCDIPLPSGVPSENIDGLKLIENNVTLNPIDGSFSVSRTYICCE